LTAQKNFESRLKVLIAIGSSALFTAGCVKAPLTEEWQAYFILGHTSPINAVAISPDGAKLYSGCDDNTIKIWELKSDCDEQIKFQAVITLKGHTRGITSLSLNRDGNLLASGGEDLLVKVWDLASMKEKCIFHGHRSGPIGKLFSGWKDDC